MDTNDNVARTAGWIYLIVTLTGIFAELYVPSQIVVRGDASATANNILASESLFRLGIATGLVSTIAFLVLPFVLYRLLRAVDANIAVLMVVLAAASVPLSFVSKMHDLDALALVSGADFLQAFTPGQLQAQVTLSLKSAYYGALVAEPLWGLWLLPFGYLVFKSGFLPRILGVLLMIGCLGYLVESFGRILSPVGYGESVISKFMIVPSAIGEVGICLWMLIMGARAKVRP